MSTMQKESNNVKKRNVTHRELLGATAAAAAFMIVPRHVLGGEAGSAPSEKANLGSIGVGGMLLGAIGWRFPNEKLLWDGKNLRFTNNDKANKFVKPSFRKGWELQDINI